MKILKKSAALIALVACGLGFAQSDFDAGRNVTVADMGGDLRLSGDVSVEYLMKSLTHDGTKQKGSTTGVANNEFDADVKLMLDYNNDKTWARVKLRSDNNMGDVSGEEFTTDGNSSVMQLKEAFFGVQVMEEGASSLSFELGRKQMNNVYNSLVQFDSREKHDGLLFTYMNSFDSLGDLTAVASGFLIDEVHDHFGWGAELNFSNFLESGLAFRYSYVSREAKRGADSTKVHQSRNSEFGLAYNFDPEMLGVDTKLHGGYVINHAATKGEVINTGSTAVADKKENTAWYLGLVFGNTEKEGDWEFDASYQVSQENSMLNADVAGAGRYDGLGANYKGYVLKGAYSVTDNLVAGMSYVSADTEDTDFGNDKDLTRFELELTYSF